MAGITEAGSSTTEAAAPDAGIYISETDFKVHRDIFPAAKPVRHRQFLRPVFLRTVKCNREAVNPASRYKLDALDGRFCPLLRR